MKETAPKPPAQDTLHEGVAEIKAKLRSDLSHWARARRLLTLKPTMGCIPCDTTGKVVCPGCGGAGKQQVVFSKDDEPCPTCTGTGQVTCVDCAGRGRVVNVHRKKVLALLWIGIAAWLLVLFGLWKANHDVLPGLGAKVEGKKSPALPAVQGGTTPAPQPVAPPTSGGYTPQPGYAPPSGGYQARPGYAPPSGGYSPGYAPSSGSYPANRGYQPSSGYPASGGYAPSGGYAAPRGPAGPPAGSYPPSGGYPPSPGAMPR